MKITKYFISMLTLVALAFGITSCENELGKNDAKQNYYFGFVVNQGSLSDEQVTDLYAVLQATMNTDSAGTIANPIYDTEDYALSNYETASAGGDEEMAAVMSQFATTYNCDDFSLTFVLKNAEGQVLRSDKVFKPFAVTDKATFTVVDSVACEGTAEQLAAVQQAVNKVYASLALNNMTKEYATYYALGIKATELWNAINPLYDSDSDFSPVVNLSLKDAKGNVVATATVEAQEDFMYEIKLHDNYTKKVINSLEEE